MSLRKIKKLRLLAGLTQTAISEKLKISQPTYQRWESGSSAIPIAKRKMLSKLLGVSVEELDEVPEKFDYLGIDNSAPDDHRYYGEIAIHFHGGAAPLLMPISIAERNRIFESVESEYDFLICRSLDNCTAAVRIGSISDIYISSDACDEYGPESERYATHLGLSAGAEFWEIVENSEFPKWIEGIPESRIKEVLGALEFDEELFQQSIARGEAEEADRDAIKADIARSALLTLERARILKWQFSNGVERKEFVSDDTVLADTLACFEVLPDGAGKIVQIPVEGWHQTIFINTIALDYIAFPSQRVERGTLNLLSKEIDGD